MRRFLRRIRHLEDLYSDSEMIVNVYGGPPLAENESADRVIVNGSITYRLVLKLLNSK